MASVTTCNQCLNISNYHLNFKSHNWPAEGLYREDNNLNILRRKHAVSVIAERDLDLNGISHSMLSDMQHCISKNLNQKMTPVTAFWYLDHYYSHFKPLGLSRRSINEIVVQAQGEHTFVDFRPTDIAFSACVAAATIALKELPEDINNMISNMISSNVIGYQVREIVHMMIELCSKMHILIEKIEVAAEEIEAEKQSLAKDKGKAVIQEPLPQLEIPISAEEVAAEEIEAEKQSLAKDKGKAVIQEPPPELEIYISPTQPPKHMMNFELKWATDVPPLVENTNIPVEHTEPRESTGCCTCS